MNLGNGKNIVFTKEGGLGFYLINKTGSPSIKGTIVKISNADDNSVVVCPLAEPQPVGAIYNDGVPDGKPVLVIFSGIAEVLLEDSTASTHGYWVKVSGVQSGRADITIAVPPGSGIPELDEHMREIGHCLESKLAGTNVLAKCIIHFN